MKALLLRTPSIKSPSPLLPGSGGTPPLSRQQESPTGLFSSKIALHMEVNRRTGGIRRALSDSDLIEHSISRFSRPRSMSFPSTVPEDVHVDDSEVACLNLERNFYEMWTSSGALVVEEVGSCGGGGGSGKGSNPGGDGGDRGRSSGGFGGGGKSIGEYYREMLKSNPGDPLLLRNYAKYLHEVARDFHRADEYYGRAILASPGDGEVLSLYGKLIWETQRDGDRARSYFDQAVQASPDDCTVLGSYAHFMWEAEDEEEEVKEEVGGNRVFEASPAAAF